MKRVLVATFVLVFVSLGLAAVADLRPVGLAFPLVSGSMDESLDAAGNSVAMFRDSHGDVWVRRVDRFGRQRGEDILIHRDSVCEFSGDVEAAPQGHFAVVWSCSYMPEPGWSGGYLLFDAEGARLASVSGYRTSYHIASDGAGNFVVARQSYWPSNSGIIIEVLDPSGAVRVPPFTPSGAGAQAYAPRVLADAAGRFTALWYESGYRAQRFGASGQPLGAPFAVPRPDIVAGNHGAFVMGPAGDPLFAWIEPDPSGTSGRIVAQRYGPDWTPTAEPFEIALTPVGADPSLVLDASGAFVVATSARDAGESGTWRLHVRRFLPDGTPDGLPVAHDTASTRFPYARVRSTPRGDVTLLWEDVDTFARPYSPVTKGDFDRDLRSDLVLRHAESGATRLWTLVEGNRSANMLVWRATPGPEWTLAGVDDFSGDGRQDLLFRNTSTGEVIFQVLGGAFGNEIVGQTSLAGAPTLSADWELAATGDFDRDGSSDLLWHNRLTQTLVVWTLDRFTRIGTLVPTPDHAADANWRVVAAADWNGDGTRDLLWYNVVSGRLVQWLLDADLVRLEGRFTNPPHAGDANWSVVAAGDYGVGPWGRPGTNDVVWRNAFSGQQVIWFFDFAGNRTAGIFTTPAAPSDPQWVASGPR